MPRLYRTLLVFLAITGATACTRVENWVDPPAEPQTVTLEAPVYCYRTLSRIQCYPTAQPDMGSNQFVGTQQPQNLQVVRNPDGTDTAVETDAPFASPPSWPMPQHP